jgi:hypothetical protein
MNYEPLLFEVRFVSAAAGLKTVDRVCSGTFQCKKIEKIVLNKLDLKNFLHVFLFFISGIQLRILVSKLKPLNDTIFRS